MSGGRGPRRVSTTLFAATVLAFLLPFGTVACGGNDVSFTGLELATYRVPDAADLDEDVEGEASWAALIVLAAAVTGLGLTASGRKGAGICATTELLGLLALLLSAATTLATISIRFGFWLAFLLATATGVWQLVLRASARARADLAVAEGEHEVERGGAGEEQRVGAVEHAAVAAE